MGKYVKDGSLANSHVNPSKYRRGDTDLAIEIYRDNSQAGLARPGLQRWIWKIKVFYHKHYSLANDLDSKGVKRQNTIKIAREGKKNSVWLWTFKMGHEEKWVLTGEVNVLWTV